MRMITSKDIPSLRSLTNLCDLRIIGDARTTVIETAKRFGHIN